MSEITDASQLYELEKARVLLESYRVIGTHIFGLDSDKLKELMLQSTLSANAGIVIQYITNILIDMYSHDIELVRLHEWLREIQRMADVTEGGYILNTIPSTLYAIKTFTSDANPSNLLHEYLVGLRVNELRAQIPNFSFTYAYISCSATITYDRDSVANWCSNVRERKPYVFSELITDYDGTPSATLSSFLDDIEITSDVITNIYFQIILALMIANEAFSFVHNDLHMGNILVKKLRDEVLVRYDDTVIITQYIPVIIDYGRASFMDRYGNINAYYRDSFSFNDIYMLTTRLINKRPDAEEVLTAFQTVIKPLASETRQSYVNRILNVRISPFIDVSPRQYLQRSPDVFAQHLSRAEATGQDQKSVTEIMDYLGMSDPIVPKALYQIEDMILSGYEVTPRMIESLATQIDEALANVQPMANELIGYSDEVGNILDGLNQERKKQALLVLKNKYESLNYMIYVLLDIYTVVGQRIDIDSDVADILTETYNRIKGGATVLAYDNDIAMLFHNYIIRNGAYNPYSRDRKVKFDLGQTLSDLPEESSERMVSSNVARQQVVSQSTSSPPAMITATLRSLSSTSTPPMQYTLYPTNIPGAPSGGYAHYTQS